MKQEDFDPWRDGLICEITSTSKYIIRTLAEIDNTPSWRWLKRRRLLAEVLESVTGYHALMWARWSARNAGGKD